MQPKTLADRQTYCIRLLQRTAYEWTPYLALHLLRPGMDNATDCISNQTVRELTLTAPPLCNMVDLALHTHSHLNSWVLQVSLLYGWENQASAR